MASGSLRTFPVSCVLVNTADSTSRERTHRPMATITAENRNGMRQPSW